MDLKKFTTSLAVKFNKDALLERRLDAASLIASKFQINPPSIVLMFTKPELRENTLEEKCQAAGVTMEEFLLCALQPRFKDFLNEMKDILRVNLDLQSLNKLGRAVVADRKTEDKYGCNDDFSIEMKTLEKGQQVTVNNNTQNNIFETARQQLLDR